MQQQHHLSDNVDVIYNSDVRTQSKTNLAVLTEHGTHGPVIYRHRNIPDTTTTTPINDAGTCQ